jgi:NAD(P)-dependent dehydrogenase (short-subunit alcohol dehydrogenase family)
MAQVRAREYYLGCEKMQLSQSRLVVTGAAGGMGRHLVEQLLRGGARIAAGDINGAGLRALRREHDVAADSLFIGVPDVTDEGSAARFVAEAGMVFSVAFWSWTVAPSSADPRRG